MSPVCFAPQVSQRHLGASVPLPPTLALQQHTDVLQDTDVEVTKTRNRVEIPRQSNDLLSTLNFNMHPDSYHNYHRNKTLGFQTLRSTMVWWRDIP